jgi:hypothetical protein
LQSQEVIVVSIKIYDPEILEAIFARAETKLAQKFKLFSCGQNFV